MVLQHKVFYLSFLSVLWCKFIAFWGGKQGMAI